MSSLIASCLLFLGMHWIVSGSPVRARVVDIIGGETRFKILFALIIAGILFWMGTAYSQAPYLPTWGTAETLKPVTLILMFIACMMLSLSIFNKNPTTLGLVAPDQVEARGIIRITRHAGLIGLGLWGVAHFIVNGDWAAHWLFGTIAFEGLVGPINLDRKYRARYGEAWEKFAQQTSYIPFAAILSNRNKLVLRELNPLGIITGVGLFAVLLHFHQSWFGV